MFGQIKIVYNRQAAQNAKPVYNAICVLNEHGEYETLLLTENDLKRTRQRALKNPEDTIALSWFSQFVIRVCRLLSIF